MATVSRTTAPSTRASAKRRARTLVAMTALFTAAGSLAMSAAVADGGGSISAAPTVSYGTQEFGNLANGTQTPDDFCDPDYRQYWALPVIAGDKVTLDWEVSSGTYGIYLNVMPVGTNDYNVDSTNYLQQFGTNDNDMAESVFSAPRTGVMPLEFRDNCASADEVGPYDFTATVRHRAVAAVAYTPWLAHTGVTSVAIHRADGAPVRSGADVSLQVRSGTSRWISIGWARVTSAPAKVHYAVPRKLRGKSLGLRAVVTGSQYQRAVSPVRHTRSRS